MSRWKVLGGLVVIGVVTTTAVMVVLVQQRVIDWVDTADHPRF